MPQKTAITEGDIFKTAIEFELMGKEFYEKFAAAVNDDKGRATLQYLAGQEDDYQYALNVSV